MVHHLLQLPYYTNTRTARQFENPVVKALRCIDHGDLTLISPEGDVLNFLGRSKGPAARLSVKDWGVLNDLMARGEIGFAEAYMDGRWDSPDLPALLTFGMVNNAALEQFFYGKPLYAIWLRLKYFMRENSLQGSRRNIMQHYDLGNDFYSMWLDRSMTYSCALFEGDGARELEDAQQAKYRRILNKLGAKPGDHVLEIGCGWGGFSVAAAKQGLKVTAVTISPAQAEYAKQYITREGLSHLANVELCDYREIRGMFDHVVSIGMFEHVGEKYWPDYFRAIKQHLKNGGTAMVQTITLDAHLFETLRGVVGFIEAYIFPGGMLPSKFHFEQAVENEGLTCGEMFNFGEDYAITLRHWLARFEANRQAIAGLGFDERFIRLWRFYLSSCIACFISRRTDVMQATLLHRW